MKVVFAVDGSNNRALPVSIALALVLSILAWRARVAARRLLARASRLVAGAGPQLRGPGDVFAWLGSEMATLAQEQLRAVLLDARANVIGTHLIYQGGRSSIEVALCDVFREAVRVGASSIVLVHNHPSRGGLEAASLDDWRLTRDAGQAGQLLAITLDDHVIIGRDARGRPGYVSLARLVGQQRLPDGGEEDQAAAAPFWSHIPDLTQAA